MAPIPHSLFEIANIRKPDGTPKRCHAHMFRDTFAVELLNKGVPIRTGVTVARA
jgi:site-specific recombinase XerD